MRRGRERETAARGRATADRRASTSTSACSSSSTTRRSDAERDSGASAEASSSASCSGVVSRMSRRIAALALALRGRRVAGAGLDADRQAHLGDRPFQIARDVDRQRLQRRDVERVQPAVAADVAAGGDELGLVVRAPRTAAVSPPPWRERSGGGVADFATAVVANTAPLPTLPRKGGGSRPRTRRGCSPLRLRGRTQLHQRRQKSRQRLAGAGRRDQQHRAAGARLRQQLELMRARRPAAACEPARKRFRQ